MGIIVIIVKSRTVALRSLNGEPSPAGVAETVTAPAWSGWKL